MKKILLPVCLVCIVGIAQAQNKKLPPPPPPVPAVVEKTEAIAPPIIPDEEVTVEVPAPPALPAKPGMKHLKKRVTKLDPPRIVKDAECNIPPPPPPPKPVEPAPVRKTI